MLALSVPENQSCSPPVTDHQYVCARSWSTVTLSSCLLLGSLVRRSKNEWVSTTSRSFAPFIKSRLQRVGVRFFDRCTSRVRDPDGWRCKRLGARCLPWIDGLETTCPSSDAAFPSHPRSSALLEPAASAVTGAFSWISYRANRRSLEQSCLHPRSPWAARELLNPKRSAHRLLLI